MRCIDGSKKINVPRPTYGKYDKARKAVKGAHCNAAGIEGRDAGL